MSTVIRTDSLKFVINSQRAANCSGKSWAALNLAFIASGAPFFPGREPRLSNAYFKIFYLCRIGVIRIVVCFKRLPRRRRKQFAVRRIAVPERDVRAASGRNCRHGRASLSPRRHACRSRQGSVCRVRPQRTKTQQALFVDRDARFRPACSPSVDDMSCFSPAGNVVL